MTDCASGIDGGKLRTQANSCITLLHETQEHLLKDGTPADRHLAGVFRTQKKYGSRDRAAITTSIFAWFRWYGWIRKAFPEPIPEEYALAAALAADGSDIPVLAVWTPDLDHSIFEYDTPIRRFDAFLGRASGCSEQDLLPEWMISELPDRNDLTSGYLQMLQKRAPLWLRAQGVPASEVRKSLLEEQGFDSKEYPEVPGAVCVLSSKNINLNGWNLYRSGKIEVQDLSSQCIGLCAGVIPGSHWLDLCAGGGGKSLQISFLTGSKGSVVSSDIRLFKLEHLKERAERAGIRNIVCREKNDALKKIYDGVLVDAPCSSSGRWRRNPEMRWVASKQWLNELNEIQKQVLSEGASVVKPGGMLAYATCSVFPCENTDIIHSFLKSHPEFTLEPFVNPHTGQMTDGTLSTLPGDGNCDGSFVARMRKYGNCK